ncbi:hypothetical protein H311_00104 [Anncaliia algerae PRA109]|nr:hypothetical protein H311_00104 [Anncaliia algerae PRA109]
MLNIFLLFDKICKIHSKKQPICFSKVCDELDSSSSSSECPYLYNEKKYGGQIKKDKNIIVLCDRSDASSSDDSSEICNIDNLMNIIRYNEDSYIQNLTTEVKKEFEHLKEELKKNLKSTEEITLIKCLKCLNNLENQINNTIFDSHNNLRPGIKDIINSDMFDLAKSHSDILSAARTNVESYVEYLQSIPLAIDLQNLVNNVATGPIAFFRNLFDQIVFDVTSLFNIKNISITDNTSSYIINDRKALVNKLSNIFTDTIECITSSLYESFLLSEKMVSDALSKENNDLLKIIIDLFKNTEEEIKCILCYCFDDNKNTYKFKNHHCRNKATYRINPIN